MAWTGLTVKQGQPLYGVAINNPDTYREGEYIVFIYRRKGIRDREAEHYRKYMPVVQTFEIDLAKLVNLT